MKSDSELKQDVLDELKWDASIDEPAIGVAVTGGIVTLSGTVKTYAEKRAAEVAAKRVKGIRAVVQDIEVRLPGPHQRTDQEIAEAALNCLHWDTLVPKDTIKVHVEHGWITLEGKVAWNYQKEAAQKAINNLYGVRGVTNIIEVKSPVQPQTVKENIKRAFERNALIDLQKIEVNAEGHKVTLTGTVQSWDEQKQAISAAWSTPGVWQVENNLEIKPREFAEVE